MRGTEVVFPPGAGDSGLSCNEGLFRVTEESRVVLLLCKGLLLCVGRMVGRIEVEMEASDCASVTGVLGACSMEDCEDFLCLLDVSAVAGNYWVKFLEDAMSIPEVKAVKIRGKDRLEDVGDCELSEFHFRFAGDAWGRLRYVIAICSG